MYCWTFVRCGLDPRSAPPSQARRPHATRRAGIDRPRRAACSAVGWLAVAALICVPGCAGNSMVMQGQMEKARQDQLAMSKQKEEIQNRAAGLDHNNEELETVLAQARQRNKLLEDEVALLRNQLNSTNAQLTRLGEEKKASEQKLQVISASMQRQGGITISPNNSLNRSLPSINLPDVQVRRDGDVIRVELPCQRLFQPGNAQLQAGASQIILTACAELLRLYPNQMIGVEGHTDNDPITNPQWKNHQQLSIGRALAVYDVMTTQARVPAAQLFVAGHGANQPLFSNATPAGKQRNSRVELVVYPERVGGG